MINIPMKSKVPFDNTNISSINDSVTHGAVSAQNVETINRWKVQEAAAGNHQSNQAAGYPSQPQTASRPAQTGGYPGQPQASPRPAQTGGAMGQTQTSPRPSQTVGYPGQSQASPRPAASTPAAMPAQKPVPQLLKPVQKGQKISIDGGTPLTALKACFGWNSTNAECDVDVSAFMLGADGKVIGDEWFVFYGQTNSPDNSTIFQMDNGTYREVIDINLQTLNPAVKKIVFVLTINEALEKHLHFGMMKDAYVRILNPQTGSELVSFQMSDYYSNVISMMIGEIYLHNGAWKFNAVGNGVAKDLMGLCELYGVQVMD